MAISYNEPGIPFLSASYYYNGDPIVVTGSVSMTFSAAHDVTDEDDGSQAVEVVLS